jgi:hypothetical protein
MAKSLLFTSNFNKSISFLVFLIFSFIHLINCDCGLPSIPTNSKINDLKTKYIEGDKIEYYCELPELTLLGGKVRECKNGKWIGSIPRCGKFQIIYKLHFIIFNIL